jgi:hypothetical protein
MVYFRVAVMIHSVQQIRMSRQQDQFPPISIAWYVSFSLPMHRKSSFYFQKVIAAGVVVRSGSSVCFSTGVYFNTGTKCCQTNLCNGASANYQTAVLMAFSALAILIKIKQA